MQDTSLLHLFNEDIGTAQRLLELINEEFQALSERDLERLEQILGNKLPLLSMLNQHGTARTQWLERHQLPADHHGLASLANRLPDGQELLDRSQELHQLLEQCRDANQRNGHLIRANQASLKVSLNILRGGETPALYNSKGSIAKIAQQRPLNQA